MKKIIRYFQRTDFSGLYIAIGMSILFDVLDVVISYLSSTRIGMWQESNTFARYPDTAKFWLGPAISMKVIYYMVSVPVLFAVYRAIRCYLGQKLASLVLTAWILYSLRGVISAVTHNTIFVVLYYGWLKVWLMQRGIT